MSRIELYIYWAVVAYILLAITAQWLLARRCGVKRTHQHPEHRASMILRFTAAMYFSIYSLDSLGRSTMALDAPLAVRALGLALMILGLALSVWAQSHLGRNWIPGVGIHPDHQLVNTGPYAYIRHPLYAGVGVAAIGTMIASVSLPASVSMGALWLSLVVRISAEEKLMAHRFKGYQRYRDTTGALIPRRGSSVAASQV